MRRRAGGADPGHVALQAVSRRLRGGASYGHVKTACVLSGTGRDESFCFSRDRWTQHIACSFE